MSHWLLTHQSDDSIPMGFPVSVPAALGQRPLTVRSSLYAGSRVAANDTLTLSSSHISAVINLSADTVSTVSEDVHACRPVPVADTPTWQLCDFDPTADHITRWRGSRAAPCSSVLLAELLCHPLPRLSHEVPGHVPVGRPHMGQVLPAHPPAPKWLWGTAHL